MSGCHGVPSAILSYPLTGAAIQRKAQGGGWGSPLDRGIKDGTTIPLLLFLVLIAGGFCLILGRQASAARKHVRDLSHLHLATMEALAIAIDAKEQSTARHIQRVRVYAVGLAKAVGVPAADLHGIETAALLHDIGKLAVAEDILSKPGPLTADEFRKVCRHSEVGADLLATVPFPHPVASLVRSHHERWDGTGYPEGLAGEQIPLGARILSLVDFFDGVTSDRPYHKALSTDTGIALLEHEAGKALDPRLVPAFIEALPQLIVQATALESPTEASPIVRRALQEIGLAHHELSALYEVAQAMGTSIGVSETAALIASKIAIIVPWSSCALFLVDAAQDLVTCRYAAGPDASALLDRTLISGPDLSEWIDHHRLALVRHRRLDADEAALPGTRFESTAVCPLIVQDRLIGTLTFYHSDPDRYTEDHRRLLERLAAQAAAVIHNAILFEQTQADSLTDPLTGLPNRRSLFPHVSRELARAERLDAEVSMLVMDLDNLKGVNDTYGHHTGDRALRAMAAALDASLRPYDLCVRYAGDEFVVVLSDCSREAAAAKQEELQERIGEIEIEARPGEFVRLSASAGASVFPHDGSTYETLLADADGRMYRNKATRRRAMHSPADQAG